MFICLCYRCKVLIRAFVTSLQEFMRTRNLDLGHDLVVKSLINLL